MVLLSYRAIRVFLVQKFSCSVPTHGHEPNIVHKCILEGGQCTYVTCILISTFFYFICHLSMQLTNLVVSKCNHVVYALTILFKLVFALQHALNNHFFVALTWFSNTKPYISYSMNSSPKMSIKFLQQRAGYHLVPQCSAPPHHFLYETQEWVNLILTKKSQYHKLKQNGNNTKKKINEENNNYKK
jgi:hypothetical protein